MHRQNKEQRNMAKGADLLGDLLFEYVWACWWLPEQAIFRVECIIIIIINMKG